MAATVLLGWIATVEIRFRALQAGNHEYRETHPNLFDAPFYHRDFKNANEVTLLHYEGSKNIRVMCYVPGKGLIEWEGLTIISPDVAVVTFNEPTSGYCEAKKVTPAIK